MRVSVSFNISLDVTKSHNPLSRTSWRRIRQQVRRRDGITCRYCGQIAKDGCVDHIVPLSKGGTDELDNLAWTCQSCNLAKSNKLLEQWQQEQQESMDGARSKGPQITSELIEQINNLAEQDMSKAAIQREIFGYAGGRAFDIVSRVLDASAIPEPRTDNGE